MDSDSEFSDNTEIDNTEINDNNTLQYVLCTV